MTAEGEPPIFLQGDEILAALKEGFAVQIRRGEKAGWVSEDDQFLYSFSPDNDMTVKEYDRYAPTEPLVEGFEWSLLRLSRTGDDGKQQLTNYFIGWDYRGEFGLQEISRHDVPPGGGRNSFEAEIARKQVNREIDALRAMGVTIPNEAERLEFDDAIRELMADTAKKRQIEAVRIAAAEARRKRRQQRRGGGGNRRPPSGR